MRIYIRFQGKEEDFQAEKQQQPEQGKIQKSTDFAMAAWGPVSFDSGEVARACA